MKKGEVRNLSNEYYEIASKTSTEYQEDPGYEESLAKLYCIGKALILSNVSTKEKFWENKVVVDLGSGSIKGGEAVNNPNMKWSPWMCRVLLNLKVKKVVGIDLGDNKSEEFESHSLDIFSLINEGKEFNEIIKESPDVIFDSNFTGAFRVSSDLDQVSPRLRDIIMEKYNIKEENIFLNMEVSNFRDKLLKAIEPWIKDGGYYVVSSGDGAVVYSLIYKKENGKLALQEDILQEDKANKSIPTKDVKGGVLKKLMRLFE